MSVAGLGDGLGYGRESLVLQPRASGTAPNWADVPGRYPVVRGEMRDGGSGMEHPVIGAWTAMLKATNKFGPDHATASFHPDGTMTITIAGYTAHGVWQASDSATARFRAVAPLGPAEGQAGWHTLAFDVQVQADGNALSLDGTHARPTPSGAPSVTAITGSGERLVIDPA